LGETKRTVREKKFIKAYIENNGNATEAYLAISPNMKRKNAKEYGSRLLQNINLSDDEITEQLGLNDAYIYEKIKEGIEATKVVSVIPIPPKKNEASTADLPDANSKNIEFVDVEDYPTRHKYLDMILKLKNKYPTEKKNIDLNVKGELEINSKIDKLVADIDIKDVKKACEIILKANAKKP